MRIIILKFEYVDMFKVGDILKEKNCIDGPTFEVTTKIQRYDGTETLYNLRNVRFQYHTLDDMSEETLKYLYKKIGELKRKGVSDYELKMYHRTIDDFYKYLSTLPFKIVGEVADIKEIKAPSNDVIFGDVERCKNDMLDILAIPKERLKK